MKKLFMICCVMVCVNMSHLAYSDPYSVTTTVTNLGINSYMFEYSVTNNDTTLTSTYPQTGLDGFYVQVPDTATISNVIIPNSYTSGGYWDEDTSNPQYYLTSITLKNGYNWFGWWGYNPASVYPYGKTATFGFRVDGVSLTTSSDGIVTFWGPNNGQYVAGTFSTGTNVYTTDSIDLQGPGTLAPVPEPATMLMFGTALAGLIVARRKKTA